jgi:hypothetical protein
VGRQGTQLLSGARREDDLEPHSGQIIARMLLQGKVGLTARLSCKATAEARPCQLQSLVRRRSSWREHLLVLLHPR